MTLLMVPMTLLLTEHRLEQRRVLSLLLLMVPMTLLMVPMTLMLTDYRLEQRRVLSFVLLMVPMTLGGPYDSYAHGSPLGAEEGSVFPPPDGPYDSPDGPYDSYAHGSPFGA
jgi:hypothetical protein